MSQRDLEKYKDEYVSSYGFERFQVKYRQQLVVEQIDRYLPKTILEIGCGTDPLHKKVKNFESYTIIDPIEDFLSAQEIDSKNNSKIQLVHSTVQDYSKSEEKFDFDMIIVSSLIHELENPEEVLESCKAIAHEQTVVHINVPNSSSIHKILGLAMNRMNSNKELSPLATKFQRHHEFSLEELVDLVEKHFVVKDSGSYFVKPLPHDQMMNLLNTEKISVATLDGYYKIIEDLPKYGSEIFINAKLRN